MMEAYVHGVSTGKNDDLMKALGADTGISKSEVSRICATLDEDVAAFRDRPLADTTYPYVFLDATYCKVRVGRRVVSQAVVVAISVAADGRREILGFEVGETESQPFWTSFLRSLKARGLLRGHARDRRRTHGADHRDRDRVRRLCVAEMPGPLHAERVLQRPEGAP